MLLSSLKRRLARSELRLRIASLNVDKEFSVKIERLKDAKIINNLLKDKSKMTLGKIEKYLGVQIKDNFLNLIYSKINLLITSTEIDEKISLNMDQTKILKKI